MVFLHSNQMLCLTFADSIPLLIEAFRQTTHKSLLNNLLSIKCTFSWRDSPSVWVFLHGLTVNLNFLCSGIWICMFKLLPTMYLALQQKQVSVDLKVSVYFIPCACRNLKATDNLCISTKPQAPLLHTAIGQVCGGTKAGFCSFFTQ